MTLVNRCHVSGTSAEGCSGKVSGVPYFLLQVSRNPVLSPADSQQNGVATPSKGEERKRKADLSLAPLLLRVLSFKGTHVAFLNPTQ